ncbi:MAG: hypothetical protein EOO43_23920 [Flavobacterium sp.]|nr:MAG: hypothetical protein EOO43_23920 [Flavobacterium sp.]
MKKSSNFPRLVHHIIGQPTNAKIDKCLNSWKLLTENGFKIKLWDDDKILLFLEKHHPFLRETFVNSRNYAEAADIARYAIVYTYGGYYADWDVEVLDKDKLLSLQDLHPAGFMLIDPYNGTIASEFFCAEPKDPYLLNLLKDIVELYETNQRDHLFTPSYSGPYRMRDSLNKHKITNMAMLKVKEVFAYDYREIRNPPSRMVTQPLIHYWLHSWINIE